MAFLAVVMLALGAAGRAAIARAAASNARIDHYYWLIAADAYRSQRGLPVTVPHKYLLEDEAQSYPPLFGILLGRFGLARWEAGAVWMLEAAGLIILVLLLRAVQAPPVAIALAAGISLAAPVRVTYNAQLNSRILGDVFLFAAIAAELGALMFAGSDPARALLWAAAIVCAALVIGSHKMSLQLYLVLLLPMALATGSLLPLAAAAAAFVLYVAVVGRRFAAYQFRTHIEYVVFWNRYWPWLGAHQFRDSPVYGAAGSAAAGRFHQPGLSGAIRHLRVVLSYAPMNIVLPVASLLSGAWPPAWLLVWLTAIYVWACATLLVPPLRCLGGGHLYIFNAVAPGACYVAWLPATPPVITLLAAGAVLTAVSLVMAWRIVRARPIVQDESFQHAVAALGSLPPSHVAVFPTQNAEAVAYTTHHAVLWGGHGHGLARLEGFFPVLTQPLSTFLRRHDVRWILWDEQYWPEGAQQLKAEGLTAAADMVFGRWRITPCAMQAATAVAGHA